MSSPSESVPTPVRRAGSRGTLARYSGWSPKIGRELNFSTRLEYLHWLLLESTPQVIQFCEYYPEVQLESWSFVFDMWLRWRDGREECRKVAPDCHYDHLADSTPRPADWTHLVRWASGHGYACELITEQKLAPHMKRIQNCRRMLPFVRYALENPDPELERLILARLAVADLPLRELLRCQQPAQNTRTTALVAKLLHMGHVVTDLDHGSFGPELLLSLAG